MFFLLYAQLHTLFCAQEIFKVRDKTKRDKQADIQKKREEEEENSERTLTPRTCDT